MVEPDFRKIEITIVGLGLIGGSFAKAIRKLNPKRLWGVDLNPDVLKKAKDEGVIDGGFTEGTKPLSSSDLVIISLYPAQTICFMKQYINDFKQGALITDTAGVKKKVIEEIGRFLREDLDFVGGHPLAGKESSGYDHGSAEIFCSANYLLTPVKANKKESLVLLEKMIRSIGCKKPIQMSPEEHDQIIALTSQLPHVIAASLINSNQYPDIENLIGGSFRDATRVAKMNVDLWSELLLVNKINVLKQIEIFTDNMTKIKLAIENNDSVSLRELLAKPDENR